MSKFRVQPRALDRIDDIFDHTRATWGAEQAERYVRGLVARFEAIAARNFPWRTIPAEIGLDGYYCRYESHFIYWRVAANGDVVVMTVLHARMHQAKRLRDDFTVDF